MLPPVPGNSFPLNPLLAAGTVGDNPPAATAWRVQVKTDIPQERTTRTGFINCASKTSSSHLPKSRNGVFPHFSARKNKAVAVPWFHRAAQPKEGAVTDPWHSWNVTVARACPRGSSESLSQLLLQFTAPSLSSSAVGAHLLPGL